MKSLYAGCLFFLILGAALLNTGTIRKDFDPIEKTKTDPISYKQKMEEIKDGEKGAPRPSFKHYKKTPFLTDPPFEEVDVPRSEPESFDAIPAVGEPIPEDLRRMSSEESEEDWWQEDSESAEDADAENDAQEPGYEWDEEDWDPQKN